MIRPKIKPQFRPPLPGPKPPAPPGLLSNIPRPGMKPPVPGLLGILPPSVLERIKEGALLPAPAVTQGVIPQAATSESFQPDPDPDNSLILAARQVGKDKGVPAAYIVDMIKQIAWHESGDNPLRRQDVKDPVDGKVKPIGKGRGAVQFEGYYGQLDENKKEMSFKDAVDRARNYYTDNLKKPVPSWIKNIKDTDDARDLSKKQQYALAIYNFRMKKGADISKVYKGEKALSDFWENSHWAGKGRSDNPNASKADRDIAKLRREAFAKSIKTYNLNSGFDTSIY